MPILSSAKHVKCLSLYKLLAWDINFSSRALVVLVTFNQGACGGARWGGYGYGSVFSPGLGTNFLPPGPFPPVPFPPFPLPVPVLFPGAKN